MTAPLKVNVCPLSESGYSSQVYAGLFDLAHAGEIHLSFTDQPKVAVNERDWGNRDNRRIAYLEVQSEGGEVVTICYDFLDGPEIISLNGLAQCSVYFKRSFDPHFLEHEPDEWNQTNPEYLAKIFPYGLNCPVNSAYAPTELPMRAIYADRTAPRRTRLTGLLKEPLRTVRGMLSQVVRGNESRPTQMVEISPDEAAEDLILFQTRLFAASDAKYAEEVEHLNLQRISVLRSVKKEYPNQFVGGFIPSPLSQKLCPDLITDNRFTRKAYFELVKRCKLAVFTRGLRQSTGWRFPEFLAASRCLISEPLAYGLPNPLREGENYLLFEDAEDALSACEKILGDAAYAQNMREQNYAYYLDNVRPAALVMNTLRTALEHAGAG